MTAPLTTTVTIDHWVETQLAWVQYFSLAMSSPVVGKSMPKKQGWATMGEEIRKWISRAPFSRKSLMIFRQVVPRTLTKKILLEPAFRDQNIGVEGQIIARRLLPRLS